MEFEWILLTILLSAFGLIFLIRCTQFWLGFSHELHYLNEEIMRVSARERPVWKRRRRRLWLSLIPFVRYRR